MAFLDPVLNPILQPILNSNPFWGVVLLAFAITLLITLAYKFLTDQKEMKRLKDEQKGFQARMKELRDQPEEMMKVQKEAMSVNMKYMKQSFKVTLITFLPLILVFGWMNAHLEHEPIFPGERYSVTAEFAEGVTGEALLEASEGTQIISNAAQEIKSDVTWNLKSSAGEHIVTVKSNGDEQSRKVLITKELKYEPKVETYDRSDIMAITVNYNKLRPLGSISLFGWQPGWLGVYIVISILCSIGLRKLMKIY